MKNPEFEVVTKLDAAERQLRVAIRLFFERKDTVPVHTLAAAALEILRQLAKPRGGISLFDQLERVRKEYRKQVVNAFKEAQNFFKHAGKDPDVKFKFHFNGTQFFLFDAAHLLHQLGCSTPEVRGYLGWFLIKYPEFFNFEDPDLQPIRALTIGIDPDDFTLVLFAIDRTRKKNEGTTALPR